ncbi:uncharacterized protein [Palaemon carinicauda]|uniref:uncharacterized protein n=1 Tax=Palaemon carinicauda TaxID=392227 RepID=UPI0035B57426
MVDGNSTSKADFYPKLFRRRNETQPDDLHEEPLLPRLWLSDRQLLDIRNKLLLIHESQRLFNTYFSCIVYLLMLESVVEAISRLYVIAAIIEETTWQRIPLFTGIFRNFSFLLFLCLAPEVVNKKRWQILDRIRQDRNNYVMDDMNKKLGRLLELMEDYPGFNIGNFFIISKRILIQIASFIATYVVILLQFSVND